ncbi:MAG: 50S ribosomal protein L3 [Kiritimatiellae bacterium]|nr:50S ribosomal protein L3 [Kiritimatiellia bacterium]MCO5060941.1 50S ribosomal protein L3 [Kiritimatiellia bacterium]MCO6400836.1 50S ribosomal protein L3 [Verrucomicrobiota bacterium]
MNGIIGKKLGMTQVYDDAGRYVPVTVLAAGPCVVVQRKTAARDGYDAAQLGFAAQKATRVNKSGLARFKKAGVEPQRLLREIEVEGNEDVKEGAQITAAIFDGVSHVDVSGVTKGQGFQGVVKRYRFGGGPQSHGHMSHRRVGSIGMRTWPSRVLKNKRMPGHMGNVHVTTQNLRVVQVRAADNVILVEGSVPGPAGAFVVIKKALKKAAK